MFLIIKFYINESILAWPTDMVYERQSIKFNKFLMYTFLLYSHSWQDQHTESSVL